MNPPCAVMNNRIFPMIRALVSRKLRDYGMSQTEIASGLGISQAMVSKYLHHPPSTESFEEAEYIASEIAGLIASGAEENAVTGLVCQWCFNLKEKGKLCKFHPVEHCTICMTLRSREAVGERYTVLHDLEKAVNILGDTDISPLVPEVRINIARALNKAESTMEVASIPGRLVVIGDRVRAPAPPEFGASRHLSALLLHLPPDSDFRAVMNIRFDHMVDRAIKMAEMKAAHMDRTEFQGAGEFLESGEWAGAEIVIDPGDFGIEPCAYILGRTAVEVVKKAQRILKFIKTDNVNTTDKRRKKHEKDRTGRPDYLHGNH